MARDLISYYQKLLINLFSNVISINKAPFQNGELCYLTQLTLLSTIIRVERKIRRLSQKKKDLVKTLHQKQIPALTKEHSIKIKSEIKNLEFKIDEYFFLIQILKIVGNSLVFSFLNKWDVKQFTLKEESGFISGKRGLYNEKQAFEMFHRDGMIAILNDLSTCLRHADITVMFQDSPPQFVECKSSINSTKRLRNQQNSIENVLNFLKGGKREVEGWHVIGKKFEGSDLSYSDQLPKLINNCLNEGYSSYSPEKGLIYCAAKDASSVNLLKADVDKMSKPSVFLISHTKHEPGYLPMPLLINEPNLLYYYYADKFVLLVCVDELVIRKKYEELGYKIEFLKNDDQFSYRIFHDDDNNKSINIGNYLFFRIIHEFISFDWFIKQTIIMYNTPYENM